MAHGIGITKLTFDREAKVVLIDWRITEAGVWWYDWANSGFRLPNETSWGHFLVSASHGHVPDPIEVPAGGRTGRTVWNVQGLADTFAEAWCVEVQLALWALPPVGIEITTGLSPAPATGVWIPPDPTTGSVPPITGTPFPPVPPSIPPGNPAIPPAAPGWNPVDPRFPISPAPPATAPTFTGLWLTGEVIPPLPTTPRGGATIEAPTAPATPGSSPIPPSPTPEIPKPGVLAPQPFGPTGILDPRDPKLNDPRYGINPVDPWAPEFRPGMGALPGGQIDPKPPVIRDDRYYVNPNPAPAEVDLFRHVTRGYEAPRVGTLTNPPGSRFMPAPVQVGWDRLRLDSKIGVILKELGIDYGWHAGTASSVVIAMSVMPAQVKLGFPVSLAATVTNPGGSPIEATISVVAIAQRPYLVDEFTTTIAATSEISFSSSYSTGPYRNDSITWLVLVGNPTTKVVFGATAQTIAVIPSEANIHTEQPNSAVAKLRELVPIAQPIMYNNLTYAGAVQTAKVAMNATTGIYIWPSPAKATNLIFQAPTPGLLNTAVMAQGALLQNSDISAKVYYSGSIDIRSGYVANFTGTADRVSSTPIASSNATVLMNQQYVGVSGTSVPTIAHLVIEASRALTATVVASQNFTLLNPTGHGAITGDTISGSLPYGNADTFLLLQGPNIDGYPITGVYRTITNSLGYYEFTGLPELAVGTYFSVMRENELGAPDFVTPVYQGVIN